MFVIKFADDTSVVGLISNNDETHYREEVAQLAEWCGANNLSLNASKTNEVVMDLKLWFETIDSSTVERVSSTKFLRGGNHRGPQLDHQHHVNLQEDTTAPTLSPPAEKRKSSPPSILTTLLQGNHWERADQLITVWYGNCSAADRKTLQRTVNTDHRCPSPLHPGHPTSPHHHHHSLFQLLPSGRRIPEYQSPLRQTAQTAFSPDCESPELHHITAPLWNPIQPPYKTKPFLCNSKSATTQVSGPLYNHL